MISYLIVCPLVFLAGFVDAIAGGGGLISLPAFFIVGIPPHMAIATNKLASSMGTTISTARYIKNGYIDFKVAILSAVMALCGSLIGSNLALLVSGKVIQYMMIPLLPIVAYYVLKNKNIGDNELTGTIPRKKVIFISMVAAFLIGTYDGFYGPGTGTFLIIIFTGLAKMDIKTASGNTKIINLSSNIAALIVFIINGKVIFSLGLVAGMFCIMGHYLGSGMVLKNGQKVVRPVILVVLGILFLKIITG